MTNSIGKYKYIIHKHVHRCAKTHKCTYTYIYLDICVLKTPITPVSMYVCDQFFQIAFCKPVIQFL